MSGFTTRTHGRRWIALLVAPALVLAAIAVVTPVEAQSPPGPLGDISAVLNEILAVLKPAPAPVVLSTGSGIALEREAIKCSFTNVGTTTMPDVISRVLVSDGTMIYETDPHSVDAGTSGGGVKLCCGEERAYRCEFSFYGVPSSARAHMEIGPSDSHVPRFVLDAK